MDVSYRLIAKVLLDGMPIEGQEYSDKVEEYMKAIKAMPVEQQATLKASYIFSRKAPREERQDLFQELVTNCLAVLAKKAPIRDVEPFCYQTARLAWLDRTRYRNRPIEKLTRGALRLDDLTTDSNGQKTKLQEIIAGEIDLEDKLNSKLDSQAVLNTLPDKVKAVTIKRLSGQTLSSRERYILSDYRKQNGGAIKEALRA